MRWFLPIAAMLGGLGVALGAFGAHGLQDVLSAKELATFETAVRYQMYHVFALLAVGLVPTGRKVLLMWSGRLFFAGTVLFSGSLYLYLVTHLKFMVFITPVGGLCFIVGWLLLFVALSANFGTGREEKL